MKYIQFCLFLLLLSCNKKNDLDFELKKVIQEYQTKISVPQSSNLKDYKFVYVVDFSMKNQDTIINIVRRPSGVSKNSNCFGVYDIGNSQPVIIFDDNHLGNYFIKNKIQNKLLDEYKLSERKRHFVDYPPVYSYLVKSKKIELIRIDTISNNWQK